MAIVIRWTATAEDGLDEILAYLEEHDFEVSLKKLLKEIDKKLKRLSYFPESGRISHKKGIRLVKVDKNINMYYFFDGSNIEILDFFDTRQNPSKRPF